MKRHKSTRTQGHKDTRHKKNLFGEVACVFVFLCLCVFILFQYAQNAQAQDISFEATVNSTKVNLGSAIQLSLTANGTQDFNPVDLPLIDNVESRYLGPATRISIINGQSTMSKSNIYTLFPKKVGHFQIPAINVILNGQDY